MWKHIEMNITKGLRKWKEDDVKKQFKVVIDNASRKEESEKFDERIRWVKWDDKRMKLNLEM